MLRTRPTTCIIVGRSAIETLGMFPVRVLGFFDAHPKDWHALHTRVLSDFRMFLVYDTVESGRMRGIMSCAIG